MTRNTTFFESRRAVGALAGAVAPIAAGLGLVSVLFVSGCLKKGDTNVEIAEDAALADAPTCANVCGRVTANDENWGGCGLFEPKDRTTCIDRCELQDAGAEAWRCVMGQPDCDAMFENCEPVF